MPGNFKENLYRKFNEGKKVVWYFQWERVECKEYLEKQPKEQGTDSLAESP